MHGALRSTGTLGPMSAPTNSNPFSNRTLPEWFATPQLGVFVHWTPTSVPAFAPLTDDPFTLADAHGWEYALTNTPYAEWYENSLAIPGSPVQQHHQLTYGNQPYDAFAPQWQTAHLSWDANEWAESFVSAGATYVVMVTKHHDGFCLWPTKTPNPLVPNWHSPRDLVGELAVAVRARGLKFGVYYSGGLDWTFRGPRTGHVITSMESMFDTVPSTPAYEDYATAHWHELIERYQPDVLWNDIHWAFDPNPLFEHYYAHVPTGVVNDRFHISGVRKGRVHADYVTPEYRSRPSSESAGPTKFEVCRGIGRSFAYNAQETDADYLSVPELQQLRNDVFAAGGNLLLNVGPTADGTIPSEQLERLASLG
jgi:alpha-L-fucosidase